MKEETRKRVAGSTVSLMHCGRAMLQHCVGLILQVRLRAYHIVAVSHLHHVNLSFSSPWFQKGRQRVVDRNIIVSLKRGRK